MYLNAGRTAKFRIIKKIYFKRFPYSSCATLSKNFKVGDAVNHNTIGSNGTAEWHFNHRYFLSSDILLY